MYQSTDTAPAPASGSKMIVPIEHELMLLIVVVVGDWGSLRRCLFTTNVCNSGWHVCDLYTKDLRVCSTSCTAVMC